MIRTFWRARHLDAELQTREKFVPERDRFVVAHGRGLGRPDGVVLNFGEHSHTKFRRIGDISRRADKCPFKIVDAVGALDERLLAMPVLNIALAFA